MIGSVVAQLTTALKSDTVGFQIHVDAVEVDRGVTLPDVGDNHIYGVDTPVNALTMNTPALLVTPKTTNGAAVRSQGVRDAGHTISFEYACLEVEEDKWRDEAMYMAEALMRFLDLFNSNNATYVGSSGVIVVDDWRVDYTVTWQAPPNAIRGFILEADILSRDSF